MSTNPLNTPDWEILRRRQHVERGMKLASALGSGLVLVAVLLAVCGVLLAQHSSRQTRQAENLLFRTSIAQIQAQRFSAQMDQRSRSLEAVRVAAQVQSTPQLREQAVAALALTGLSEPVRWSPIPFDTGEVVVDDLQQSYALLHSRTNIECRLLSDDRVVFSTNLANWRDPTIQLSPDGSFLGAYTPEKVRVWDIRPGREVLALEGLRDQEIRHFAFDPKGPRAACTDGKDIIRLFDLAGRRQLHEFGGGEGAWFISFHPLKDQMAVETEKEIRILDQNTGKLVQRLEYQNSGTAHLAWSPDGALLAAGRFDGEIDVWNLRTGHSRRLKGHTREVFRVAFHPKGYLVSYSFDNTLRLWDPWTGTQFLKAGGLRSLGIGSTTSQLAVWRHPHGIGLLDIESSDVFRAFDPDAGRGKREYTLDFDQESKRLLISNEHGFWVLDPLTGRLMEAGELDRNTGAHFLEDGRVLTLSDLGLHRWDRPDSGAAPGFTLDRPEPVGGAVHGDAGYSAMDARRERIVFHVSNRGYGEVRDARKGTVLLELRGNFDFSGPQFSPDGRWIASGCWNPVVSKRMFATVWDAQTGRVIKEFSTTKCSVLFSPNNRWLVLGSRYEYKLIRTDTWEVEREFPISDSMVDHGYATFSQDSSMLAIRANDRVIRLVSPDSGAELARLNSPDQSIVRNLRFSPDRRWLATSTESGVKLWDLANLRRELTSFGLDWSEAGNIAGGANLAGGSGKVSGSDPFALVIPLIVTGVVAALGIAVWLRRYQRELLQSYGEVEALTARRGEQLALAQIGLAHSQKMQALGTLAAGIAHDFNNLLSVIRMSNGLIARESRQQPSILENTEEIEMAVKQGKNVVRSMLGYSREDSPRSGPYSVPVLVEDSVGLLSKEFLRGITLSLELDRSVPLVAVSSSRLEQTLLNLLVNASEAMNGEGRLRIAVHGVTEYSSRLLLKPKPSAAYVTLVVSDSGPGIPEEVVPRIFEPFFTTKTSGAARGTGLGLSLIYTFARDEEVGLGLETGAGQGTTFTLIIPACV